MKGDSAEKWEVHMERAKRVLTAAVYGVGTAVTVFLTAVIVSGWDLVLFPDAMLPMQISELASVWLAWGTLPMGIASALFYRRVRKAKGGNGKWKAICIFLPAIICGCFFVYWIFVWTGLLALAIAFRLDYGPGR